MDSLIGKHWHHLPAEEVVDLLGTDPNRGLDILSRSGGLYRHRGRKSILLETRTAGRKEIMKAMNEGSAVIARVLGVAALASLAFLGAFATPGPESGAGEAVMSKNESFLIDDFSSESGVSAFGTEWRMFTDRVMGGVSDAASAKETIDGRRCLRLKGRVSLKNNGGFIQVALPLSRGGRSFDAGQFKGVRVWVRGNGKSYHVHLRTGQSRRPWEYFSAPFDADASWQAVEIPFDRFKSEGLGAKLDTRDLERIAIVAIGEEMEADVAVSRLEFYR